MADRKTTLKSAELVSAEARHGVGYISRVRWDGGTYGEAAFRNLIRSCEKVKASTVGVF